VKYFILVLTAVCIYQGAYSQPEPSLFTADGILYFKSEAPLELIEASSDQLRGIIDFTNQTFAFSVAINTFRGFNSALQREHFNENYMESAKYPKAVFSGKLIERIDFTKDGEYKVRAKGKLSIHGVEQERIIQSSLKISNGSIFLQSYFTILLVDHNIPIPKVVQQKIAEVIKVYIEANCVVK